MAIKLSEKDKKTLKLGAIAAICIIVFTFGLQGYELRKKQIESYKELQGKFKTIESKNNLAATVPVFEMPLEKDEQRFTFRDRLNVQFDSARINNVLIQEEGTKAMTGASGYDLLRLKCTGQCSFTQLLNLLADLKQNPYLVGIEELRFKFDSNNQQQADFTLTVSTLTKK